MIHDSSERLGTFSSTMFEWTIRKRGILRYHLKLYVGATASVLYWRVGNCGEVLRKEATLYLS